MTPLAPHLEAFFASQLPRERGASVHTSASYADAFRLLLSFASAQLKCRPSKLMLEALDARLVVAFLNQLEEKRGNSAATRNARLAAIRSFMRFLEARVPERADQIRRVLTVPFKKTDEPLVPFLTSKEWTALVGAPDPRTWLGARDRALLYLAVTCGLRVSELADVCLDDITLRPHAQLAIQGKGRRHRELPIWKDVAIALRRWLAIRGQHEATEVFVTTHGEALTRAAIEDIVRRHTKRASESCPSLREKKVSPHVLRHTCAMIILQATGDLRKVALWLGHAHLETTEVYTRASPVELLVALEHKLPMQLRPGRFRVPDHLMAFLKEQSLCEAQHVTVPRKQPRSRLSRA